MMDEMNPEQKKVVEELRKRTIKDVTPKMLEDVCLFYRFAKARDFNLVEAEIMLRKHIAWRLEMEVDTILTDYKPPEVLVKYVAATFICFDKEGRVVLLLDMGRLDVKGLWNVVSKEELGKYAVYIIERDKDMFIKKGGNPGTPMYTVIYDFESVSYANIIDIKTPQNLTYLMKLFIDNYPETIKRVISINAPYFCALIFSIIKQAIPENVYDKFQIHGKDGWKEKLLEFIDADLLPAYLGGKRTDPDGNPLCETFILRGRPIPKSYYPKKGKKLCPMTCIEKLTVKPLSKKEIYFEVIEKDLYIELEFETKERDIDFSFYYKEPSSEDSERVSIINKQRIHAGDEREKGCYQCEKPGIYTIVFDNSYSWFYSKEVHYRAELKKSKNGEKYSLT